MDPLRLREHLHGHLGWLAAAALVHPAIVLRRAQRRAHLAVGLGLAFCTLAAVLGVTLYGPYRETLRQPIFASAPHVGYLFERKEHLAFAATMLAWTGSVCYFGARCVEGGARTSLRRAAHWAFVVSAIFAIATATLGTIVAAYRTF